jgi:hypothetical protein
VKGGGLALDSLLLPFLFEVEEGVPGRGEESFTPARGDAAREVVDFNLSSFGVGTSALVSAGPVRREGGAYELLEYRQT